MNFGFDVFRNCGPVSQGELSKPLTVMSRVPISAGLLAVGMYTH